MILQLNGEIPASWTWREPRVRSDDRPTHENLHLRRRTTRQHRAEQSTRDARGQEPAPGAGNAAGSAGDPDGNLEGIESKLRPSAESPYKGGTLGRNSGRNA